MYTKEEKQILLSLARRSIRHYLDTGEKLSEMKENFPQSFWEKMGVFVTLTIDGALRGCIGNIMPVYPLYKGVIENSVMAAFDDPRFPPISDDEFDKLNIEISVLTVPTPLKYDGKNDLLKKLKPGIDGVVIKKGFNQATFLPQVWDEIKNPEDFLSHLCAKAGMEPYEWEKGDLEVAIYSVMAFDERELSVPAQSNNFF